MLLVHRNPHGVGLPFSRRLLPVAALAQASLGRRAKAALRSDPTGLVLVASFLDEPLPLGPPTAASTAVVALSASRRRANVAASFHAVDALRAADDARPAQARLRSGGVDLLDALRWEAHYPLLAALDFADRLDLVLERHRPTSLTAFGHPAYVRLAAQVAARRAMPFTAHAASLPLAALRAVWSIASPKRAKPPPAQTARASEGVLLLANGRGSALNAHALARELEARGWATTCVARGGPAKEAVPDRPALDLDAWIQEARAAVPRAEIRRLRRSCKDLGAEPAARAAFDSQGLALWPACGEDVLRGLAFRVPELLALVEGTHRLLDAVHPRIVVTGFDPGLENRVMAAAARARGIPSVTIQDGLLSDADLLGLAADHLCADDPATEHAFLQGGVAPTRVHVTGQPRMDGLALAPAGTEATRRALDAAPGTRLAILFASTGEDSASDAARKERDESWVVREFAQRPGWSLIVKLHPHADAGEGTRRLVERAGARNVQVRREPGADLLLPAADLVLCATASTAALEALRARKPVLVLDLDQEDPMPELAAAGAVLRLTEPAGLAQALDDLPALAARLGAAAQAYGAEHLAPADGRAAARVADVVERVAGHSPR